MSFSKKLWFLCNLNYCLDRQENYIFFFVRRTQGNDTEVFNNMNAAYEFGEGKITRQVFHKKHVQYSLWGDCCEPNLNGSMFPSCWFGSTRGLDHKNGILKQICLYTLVIALGYESFSKQHSKIREVFITRWKTKYTMSGMIGRCDENIISWLTACFMVTLFYLCKR